MFVSLSWMRDYVALPEDIDARQLAHELTLRTVEVEGYERTLERVSPHAVVGRVLDAAEQPAGRWMIQVDVGHPLFAESAQAVPVGSLVAVATEAEGDAAGRPTLCRPIDIGLASMYSGAEAAVLLDLSEADPGPAGEAVEGTPVASLIGWDDIVFEIDNKSLTNRPDLWSHHGIARELAAIFGLAAIELPAPRLDPAGERPALIGVVDEAVCNRMTVMEIASPGPMPRTPLLVRSRLARIGQRSIGFFADLTNYVMFAVGQPSHAYDRASFNLPLSVKTGITAPSQPYLHGGDLPIEPGIGVIVAGDTPVAIAGVVGNSSTQSTDASTSIVLEMANFKPVPIRRAAISLRSRTEASSRFEKGLDTQAVDRGRALLLDLLARYHPSAEVVGHADRVVNATTRAEIATTADFLGSRLGRAVSAAEVQQLLSPLGIDVEATSGGEIVVEAPTWRSTGDIGIPNDILEEVARMIGYDNLPELMPTIDLRPIAPGDRLETLQRRVREYFALRVGAQEVLTYPWAVDSCLASLGLADSQDLLQIDGAPSPDRSHLRPSLLPNLLAAVDLNLSHASTFTIFEVGTVYRRAPGSGGSAGRSAPPRLGQHLGAMFVGEDLASVFRRATGAIEGLPRAARIDGLALERAPVVPWGDHQSAMQLVSNGDTVGHLGALDLRGSIDAGTVNQVFAVAVEVDLARLSVHRSRTNTYERVSQFPGSSVDLSFVVDEALSWAEIEAAVRASEIPLLTDIEFLDEYRSESIVKGRKSVTIRLHLESKERTLSSGDKYTASKLVSELLEGQLGAVMRA